MVNRVLQVMIITLVRISLHENYGYVEDHMHWYVLVLYSGYGGNNNNKCELIKHNISDKSGLIGLNKITK